MAQRHLRRLVSALTCGLRDLKGGPTVARALEVEIFPVRNNARQGDPVTMPLKSELFVMK